MKVLLSLGLVASLSLSLPAQTIDDGIMLRGRESTDRQSLFL